MSQASTPTPFRDGFAALWHEPALLAAELTWRWCFGLSALTLGLVSIGLFLNGLKVSRADEFLISTLQPELLAGALHHIFHGSLARFVLEQTLLIAGMMLLWSLAAAAGRAATLRRMVAMFSTEEELQSESMDWHFAPILLLQLLRAMWLLIALVVLVILLVFGCVMAARERPLAAALTLSFGIGFAWLTGATLNWYFAVAPIFCIRDGLRAREALAKTVEFSDRHSGRLFLLSVGFFLLRLVWSGMMCLAFLAPLNLSGKIGNAWIALLMGFVALIYFAGIDFFALAKLAAYVSLAEDDARPVMDAQPAAIESGPPLEPLLGLA